VIQQAGVRAPGAQLGQFLLEAVNAFGHPAVASFLRSSIMASFPHYSGAYILAADDPHQVAVAVDVENHSAACRVRGT
jgi:hypothetical protein